MKLLNKSCTGLALCSLVLLAGCGGGSRTVVKNHKKPVKIKYHPHGPKRYENGSLRTAGKAVVVGGGVSLLASVIGVVPAVLLIPIGGGFSVLHLIVAAGGFALGCEVVNKFVEHDKPVSDVVFHVARPENN